MNQRFKLANKVIVGAAAFFMMNFASAQTVGEGINDVDSYKFAKAKEVFSSLVASKPSDANYFYLGNTYLVQTQPDFNKAAENFNKGVATDSKRAYLSKIGLSTIKLGKGNKQEAIADFAQIAKDSKDRNPEVLFRIGQALTLFEKNNNPKLAIEYLNNAIDLASKDGVPANYYYTLGDANRLNKSYGDAMTAYDNALSVAKNKAAIYTRMGTLWTSAKKYDLALQNINKAIAADPSYSPAYKALGDYNIIFQRWDDAAGNYKKYLDLADADSDTVLDYAKLAFIAKDYNNASQALDSAWNSIDDPIKYRIKAYLQYQNKDYKDAKVSLDTFLSKADKSRIIPSDSGLEGLIMAAIGKETNNSELISEARQKVAVAQAANDETFDWAQELASVSGVAIKTPSDQDGPTNPTIEALKKQVAADPKNTDLLYKLAVEYQNAQNWGGAASAWKALADEFQTWEPAYYSLGFALQKAGDPTSAMLAYQKYIDVLGAKSPEEQAKGKELLGHSYFNMASITANKNREKALEYINKALEVSPDDADSIKLKEALSK